MLGHNIDIAWGGLGTGFQGGGHGSGGEGRGRRCGSRGAHTQHQLLHQTAEAAEARGRRRTISGTGFQGGGGAQNSGHNRARLCRGTEFGAQVRVALTTITLKNHQRLFILFAQVII